MAMAMLDSGSSRELLDDQTEYDGSGVKIISNSVSKVASYCGKEMDRYDQRDPNLLLKYFPIVLTQVDALKRILIRKQKSHCIYILERYRR
jgi:hypothetical protein